MWEIVIKKKKEIVFAVSLPTVLETCHGHLVIIRESISETEVVSVKFYISDKPGNSIDAVLATEKL